MSANGPNGKSPTLWEKVGAVRLPIYPLADGRHCIVYRLTAKGPRKRVTRVSLEEARKEARRLCIAIANGQTAADHLSAESRLRAAAAISALTPLGLTLDGAAREITQAHQLTGGASIPEMARFWAKHHASAAAMAVPLHEIHARMLASMQEQKFSPRWHQALKKDLGKFVDDFAQTPIGEILADTIQEWLQKQPGNWRTRNNRLALIKQFFHFAKRRKILPQDRNTEADAVDPLSKPRGAHSRIGVLSAEQLAALLAHVGDAWLPFVALGAFGGYRRAEIERLQWEDVRWEEGIIRIREEVAKSTHRKAGDERFPKMRDQLVAWLSPWRHATGPVCTRKRFEDELARLAKAAKNDRGEITRPAIITYAWPKNALRHTYGSCRTSETQNMPQVADEMGTSVQEIRRDYRNPRTEREVQAWASLWPPATYARKIVVHQFAG